MRYNILIGGKAGQGPNALADIVSEGIIARGWYVFNSREYPSVIRGGHNYNTVSLSEDPIASNHDGVDILVSLDENTEKLHKSSLNKKAIVLKPVAGKGNMFFAGALFKIFNLDFNILERKLAKMRNYELNLRDARQGYSSEKREIKIEKIIQKEPLTFKSGSETVALAAVKSGLDYYYSYPMTPATPAAAEIAQLMMQKTLNPKHIAIELESEIGVINATIGSSMVGAKAMCGSSGGGFDLMTESLSLAGQAEVPIVIYLCQRPGPSTGLATYTGQADLNCARYAGHGEFSRVVLTPGDAKECINATNEAFYLSEKFRIPTIVLSDKHVAESKYTFIDNVKIIESPKAITEPERFNSYEHDAKGIATEDVKIINKNFERRLEKQKEIEKECSKLQHFKIHGNKNSKNVVVGWGSTKGAILDAITYGELDCKFVQILCVEPFPKKIKEEIEKASKIIVVENNATSPLSSLISEKTGIFIDDKNKILKYDGRAFTSCEVEEELGKRGVK